MNRIAVITIAILALTTAAVIAIKSKDRPSNPASAAPSNSASITADPAMTTQPIQPTRQEGVTPLPSDAVGTSSAPAESSPVAER